MIFQKMLKFGDKGPEVRSLQIFLGDVKVDDKFGAATLASVIRFQRKHDLVPDGKAGPKTLALLFAKPQPVVTKPIEKTGGMADVIPFAKQSPRKMKMRGKYAKKYPQGAIVHFTAGRDGAQKTIDGGIGNGFTFLCLEESGTLVQAHDVSQYGYHAGKSDWGERARGYMAKLGLSKLFKPLSGTVSDDLIGIEINVAGMVKKQADGSFKTWFGTTVPADRVRYSKGTANQAKGYYHTYTASQEETLIETLLWLKSQAPNIFDFDCVLGHDEVSPGRKTDPGASLSMTMPELRERLKAEWAKRTDRAA